MANTARKGSGGELFVRADLEAKGGLVGSRRHIGGAGDELVVFPTTGQTWLVEIKTIGASQSPYKNFTRADRQAMRETPLPPGGSRWLAVVRGSGKNRTLEYVPEHAWP